MSKTAEDLIQAYSVLSRKEQSKFDKRYKSLQQFKANLQFITNALENGIGMDKIQIALQS